MKLKVKYSGKFKKGLKSAAKRGLDISLLENVVEKLKNRMPLEEKYQDHPLKGKMSKEHIPIYLVNRRRYSDMLPSGRQVK